MNDTGQSFFVRYSLLGFVLLGFVALAAGLLLTLNIVTESAHESTVHSTEAESQTLSLIFVGEVWPDIQRRLPKAGAGADHARGNPQLKAIDERIRRFANHSDIVKIKMKDLNARSEEAAAKIIAGTARQMGVEVEL